MFDTFKERKLQNPSVRAAYDEAKARRDSEVQKWAWVSEDGLYRYSLQRTWKRFGQAGHLAFVMLNPSTADAEVDDPTIRRCMGFARSLGYDGINVLNLYAFRATKPVDLWKADEPTGGKTNDDLLREVLRQGKARPVIAAWGANAKPDRVAEFMSWKGSEHVLALGFTKAGAPRHPLYLRADSQPLVYRPADSAGDDRG